MKLDLRLLKRLLVIDHPSKQEWPMLSFIINECYKIGGLDFEMDSYNNIFITKNSSNPEYYPAVVCHTDCVLPHKNKQVDIQQGKIFGKDVKTNKRIGLGMDDANGICCAIQLLKSIPNLKVCFTTEEEIGYNGAYSAAENIDFWYNVSYMIQADRHGKSDLITFTNGIDSASDKWLEEASGVMAEFGYSEAPGIGTDIGVLAEELKISGVNISCGYYKEHTDKEYTIISELQNCLNFMEKLLFTIPTDKQYDIKIEYVPRTQTYGGWDWNCRSDAYDDSPREYDDDDDLPCHYCTDYDCMNCKKNPW